MLEREMPTQQEMIAAIIAAWNRHEAGQGIPHTAWAVYAAAGIEVLFRQKSK